MYQKPNGPIHLTFVKLNLTSELEKALARQISYFIPRKSKIFEYQKTFILFDSASKVSSHLSGVRISLAVLYLAVCKLQMGQVQYLKYLKKE